MPSGCGNDRITVKEPGNDTVKQCLNCPRCSKGKGASVQCDSVITPETPVMCEHCVLGETFSGEDGTGKCEHCFSCPKHNRETLENCTLTSNSECAGCKPGFYPDRLTSQCEPCSPCCGDGRDTEVIECKDQKLPGNKVCSVARVCAKTPTPSRPAAKKTASNLETPGPRRHSPKMKATSNNGSVLAPGLGRATVTNQLSSKTVASTPQPATRNGSVIFMRDGAPSTYQPPRRADQISTPLLAVPAVIVILIVAIVYRLKHKRRPTSRRSPRAIMEEGPSESMSLVGIAAVDERTQEEAGLPTQNTEGPGRFYLDKPLVEMSKDSSFYLEVNQVIVKAGGLNIAVDRFVTEVGELTIDRGAHAAGRVFVDAVMKKFPSMSGKKFFEAVVG